MEIKVRLAEKEDFRKLLNLFIKVNDFHHKLADEFYHNAKLKKGSAKERKLSESKELVESLKNKNTKIFVAFIKKKLVGFMTVSLLKMNANCKYQRSRIEDSFVLEKFRNKKISSLLLNEAFSFFNSKNVKLVSLDVSSNNIPAIKFYEKFGFHEELKTMELILPTSKSS